jgi:hypothetical protein
MSKAEKKTPIFYNQGEHHSEMSKAYEVGLIFKRSKDDLEKILGTPIADYAEFRKDPLGYAKAEIRKAFPKPFELGLTEQATLKMLSIDLRQIERDSLYLATNPIKFCVCPKTGAVSADECKEDYIWYATTDEQHQRLDFGNELANILERAYLFTPHTFKSNVTNGLTHIVYFDVQTETIKPNHFFVMNGIK